MDKLLKILDGNARMTVDQLAAMLDITPDEVQTRLSTLEKAGIVCGYKTLIDWDKTDRAYVCAVIDLQIAPSRDRGFDAVAEAITAFEEVESVKLMSGGYDLSVIVSGQTLRDVAMFVATRLAPLDGVLSTATHFVLKTYKEHGVLFTEKRKDERGQL